ncbi:uncharacterized protein [Heterodontus francisci]|uniref:uncharacterized protein n=1 Tax=Heterodontus francisci TaxID=7792 RepID=UPI00355B8E10
MRVNLVEPVEAPTMDEKCAVLVTALRKQCNCNGEDMEEMLPGLEKCSYEERLERVGLISLEKIKLRGNLIEIILAVTHQPTQATAAHVEVVQSESEHSSPRAARGRPTRPSAVSPSESQQPSTSHAAATGETLCRSIRGSENSVGEQRERARPAAGKCKTSSRFKSITEAAGRSDTRESRGTEIRRGEYTDGITSLKTICDCGLSKLTDCYRQRHHGKKGQLQVCLQENPESSGTATKDTSNSQRLQEYNFRWMTRESSNLTVFPGSCHDAFIVRQSEMHEFFRPPHETSRLDNWRHGLLTEGMLLMPVQKPSTNAKKSCNISQATTRTTIEQAIKLLKMLFRCFDRSRGALQYRGAVLYSARGECREMTSRCILRGLLLLRVARLFCRVVRVREREEL